MSTKHFCDICGKELFIGSMCLLGVTMPVGYPEPMDKCIDLCTKCYMDIFERIQR